MKLKMIALSACIAIGLAPSAVALTQDEIKRCNAMAASFAAKKAEITEAKALLDAKAEETELAGERWEAAEAMKLMSPQAAKEAEDSKAAWDALKKDVYREQIALQSRVKLLNSDVASFNASCATK